MAHCLALGLFPMSICHISQWGERACLVLFLWNQNYSIDTTLKLKGPGWLNYKDQTFQSIPTAIWALRKAESIHKMVFLWREIQKEPYFLCVLEKGQQVTGVQNTGRGWDSLVWNTEQLATRSTLAHLRRAHVTETHVRTLGGQVTRAKPEARTRKFEYLWENAAYDHETWKKIGITLIFGIKYSNCHYDSSIIKTILLKELEVLFFKVLLYLSGFSIALQPKSPPKSLLLFPCKCKILMVLKSSIAFGWQSIICPFIWGTEIL